MFVTKLARGPKTAWAFSGVSSNREYGEARTLESVISAHGEAISMSEEDPVQGYESTKSASETAAAAPDQRRAHRCHCITGRAAKTLCKSSARPSMGRWP